MSEPRCYAENESGQRCRNQAEPGSLTLAVSGYGRCAGPCDFVDSPTPCTCNSTDGTHGAECAMTGMSPRRIIAAVEEQLARWAAHKGVTEYPVRRLLGMRYRQENGSVLVAFEQHYPSCRLGVSATVPGGLLDEVEALWTREEWGKRRDADAQPGEVLTAGPWPLEANYRATLVCGGCGKATCPRRDDALGDSGEPLYHPCRGESVEAPPPGLRDYTGHPDCPAGHRCFTCNIHPATHRDGAGYWRCDECRT